MTALAVGAGLSLALAGAAWAARALTVSGVLAAVLVGTSGWVGLGWRGFLVLAAFFVLASGLTRLGYRRKAAAGLAEGQAEGRGGRRTASQVLANGGVAGVAAPLAAFAPESVVPLLAVAFAAAFAAAAADTASTEVGQLLRRRTLLVTTLRPVPPGTDGGVSLPGTAAALGATLLVAGLGGAVGLYGPAGALAAAAGGFLGALADSLLGASLERRGYLDNDRVNLLATLSGALLGALLAWIVL
ncbi:MAG TPA: DUF92 domain-containing protein [Thermoanaerobaculia bacterium]|nr:DUF92 domain-containing protein [Thermoanaerobaculia bacterium]